VADGARGPADAWRDAGRPGFDHGGDVGLEGVEHDLEAVQRAAHEVLRAELRAADDRTDQALRVQAVELLESRACRGDVRLELLNRARHSSLWVALRQAPREEVRQLLFLLRDALNDLRALVADDLQVLAGRGRPAPQPFAGPES